LQLKLRDLCGCNDGSDHAAVLLLLVLYRMGTHSNGPSRIVRDGKPAELLSDYLQVGDNGTLP
jgi:hypothetical protein